MKPADAHSESGAARDLAAEIQDLVPPGKNVLPPRPASAAQVLLDQKFHALNQLSGGIAHEFNNIIAGILGSAELVGMDISEAHPAHESLRQIFEASNRGRDFLHKVRVFSQRPVIERRPGFLPPIIEETLQILRGVIPERVELRATCHPGCPRVDIDAAQIQQVILDLCLYCWQGLHERRGVITLTLTGGTPEKNFPSSLPPGDYVHLAISDDSQGLDHHAVKKIFDPFHSRRSSKKTGLEMFLARETVHAHQGELLAVSAPGQGLAFHIYLPVFTEAVEKDGAES